MQTYETNIQSCSYILRVLLGAVLLLMSLSAYSGIYITPPEQKPIPVLFGIYVLNISSINVPNKSVGFEVVVRSQWHDSRLAFDPQQHGTKLKVFLQTEAMKKLNTIWRPFVSLESSYNKRIITTSLLTISSKGVVTILIQGHFTLRIDFDVRSFPFDKQTWIIKSAPILMPLSKVRLIADQKHSGIAKKNILEEWQVESAKATVVPHFNRQIEKEVSQYQLTIKVKRLPTFYILQVLLPLFLITCLSFLVYWLRGSPMVNRVAILLSSLLALTMLQWRIFEMIPHVAYLTFIGSLSIFSLLMVILVTISSVIIYNATKHKDRLMLWLRFSMPLIYVLGTTLLWLIFRSL